jgi:very-short-patch-repair endonuclease
MTQPERILWRAIREALPQCHWRKQVPLGPYFADFASHSAKLIVELDGGQHASAVDYDAERTRFIEAQGYRVLRFWNNDVLTNTDGVLERIARSLSRREREGGAQRRKGEAEAQSSSPSHLRSASAGPSLSQGRGALEPLQ